MFEHGAEFDFAVIVHAAIRHFLHFWEKVCCTSYEGLQ